MNSSQSISPDEIYQNWLTGNNECEDCKRRDKDGACAPYFGFGDFPAEVVFLGEAPGGTATGGNNYLNTDNRVWKNYREVADEAGETDSAEISNYTPGLDGLSDSHHKQLKPFFDAMRRELEEIDRPESLYYTNVAKCSDIWDRAAENRRNELNDPGKRQCRDAYLLSELQGVDPNVIVLFSNGVEHITNTLKALGVRKFPSESRPTSYVFNFEYESSSSPFNSYYSPILETHIIVSYHYQQGYTTTTKLIDSGKIRGEDIGRSSSEYSSDATTPRQKYADEVAAKMRELIVDT